MCQAQCLGYPIWSSQQSYEEVSVLLPFIETQRSYTPCLRPHSRGPGLELKQSDSMLWSLPASPKCTVYFQIVVVTTFHHFRKGEEGIGCLFEERELVPGGKGEQWQNHHCSSELVPGFLKIISWVFEENISNLLKTAQKPPMVILPHIKETSLKGKFFRKEHWGALGILTPKLSKKR